MGKKKFAARIEGIEENFVEVAFGRFFEAEADEVECARRDEFEARIRGDKGFKEFGNADVFADVRLESADTVMTNDEPEFEGAEAASERNLPVAIVEDFARIRGAISEVFGSDRERIGECATVAHKEAVAIEIGEQPLVGVEAERVAIFDAPENVTKFRADGGSAGVGCIDVQPGRE